MIKAIYFGIPSDGSWVDVTEREPVFHDGQPQAEPNPEREPKPADQSPSYQQEMPDYP